MAHIKVPENLPGILGPMAFSPKTAKPLNALAEVLLRGPNSLSAADREMIAAMSRHRTIATSARMLMAPWSLTVWVEMKSW